MSRNIILRVVEMWHETVLDERCFAKGGVVFGTADLGLPPLFTLFRRGWKGWTAILAPGMEGELSVGGETRPIAEIVSAPDTKLKKRKGDWRAVAIAAGDWGVVKVRNHTFFFQLTPRESAIP